MECEAFQLDPLLLLPFSSRSPKPTADKVVEEKESERWDFVRENGFPFFRPARSMFQLET